MKIYEKLIIGTYAVSLSLALSGCGGSSGSSDSSGADETTENKSPVANAGIDVTTYEQSSVTLSAEQSVDDDTLSYSWTQVSGPEASISNPTSKTPTLLVPAIESDTEIVMALAVDDGVNLPVSDLVKVRVLNESLDQKKLRLHPRSAVLQSSGSTLDVAFDLDSAENIQDLTGLVVNVHWDSKALAFKELGEVLMSQHLGTSEPISDEMDIDNNSRTDRYVTISWVDFNGSQWISNAQLPLSLFSARFDPVNGAKGSTQITVSQPFTSQGFGLNAQTVSVELL